MNQTTKRYCKIRNEPRKTNKHNVKGCSCGNYSMKEKRWMTYTNIDEEEQLADCGATAYVTGNTKKNVCNKVKDRV